MALVPRPEGAKERKPKGMVRVSVASWQIGLCDATLDRDFGRVNVPKFGGTGL